MASLQRCVLLVDVARPGCTVMYANPAWQALTGTPCSAAEGAALTQLFTSDSRRSLEAAVVQMASSGRAFRLDGAELASDRLGGGGASGSHLVEGGEAAGCGAGRGTCLLLLCCCAAVLPGTEPGAWDWL